MHSEKSCTEAKEHKHFRSVTYCLSLVCWHLQAQQWSLWVFLFRYHCVFVHMTVIQPYKYDTMDESADEWAALLWLTGETRLPALGGYACVCIICCDWLARLDCQHWEGTHASVLSAMTHRYLICRINPKALHKNRRDYFGVDMANITSVNNLEREASSGDIVATASCLIYLCTDEVRSDTE
mgnify:CR=1 FL=1